MPDKYNPFDQKHRDRNPSWWIRTQFQIAGIAGLAALAFKMKGPTGTLVNKFFKKTRDVIEEREQWKAADQATRAILSKAAQNPPPSDFDIQGEEKFLKDTKGTYHKGYRYDKTGNMLPADQDIVKKVGSLEVVTLKKINYDLNNDFAKTPLNFKNWYFDYSMPHADMDDVLQRARMGSLWQYFNQSPPLDEKDIDLLKSVKETESDHEQIKELSAKYIATDPDYALIYTRNLQILNKNYSRKRNNLIIQQTGEKFDTLQAKKCLYGDGDFADTPEEIATLRAYSRDRKIVFPRSNIFELLEHDVKINSGSLEKRFVPNHTSFKVLGQFDYTSSLKGIIDECKSLEDRRDKTGIQKVTTEIVQEGSSEEPRFYLELTFHHTNKPHARVFKMALSQHGLLPGTSGDSTPRLERIFHLPDAYGKVDRKLVPNKNAFNHTQLALSQIKRLLSGTLMDTFNVDPDKVIQRLNNAVRNIYETAPTGRGELTDVFNMTSIELQDHRIDNKIRLQRSFSSINRLHDLVATSKGEYGVVNITVDLETIGRGALGPEHQPKDVFTQITEAGYSVSEYKADKSMKVTFTHANNIVSDHGFDIIDKCHDWSPEQIEWMRNSLPDRGRGYINERVPKLWAEANTAKSAAYTTRTGLKFKNNKQIATQLIKEIREVARQARKDGKKVFITTKNGTDFDLPLLEHAAPQEYEELKKLLHNHIDIQSIAYYQQVGYGGEKGLSQNQLLKDMMGYYGLKEYDADVEGNTSNILQTLRHQKHKGNHLIEIDDSLLTRWRQENLLVASHSAGADSLLLHTLVGYEANKLIAGTVPYKQYGSFVEEFFNRNKDLDLIDQVALAASNERSLKILGVVPSAYAMGQKQIAESRLSLMTSELLETFPDNAFNRQHYQKWKGCKVSLRTDKFNKNMVFRTDIERRRAMHRMLHPSLMSDGSVNLLKYHYGADAMRQFFSNSLIHEHVFAFSSMEGSVSVSKELLSNYHIHKTIRVDMSDITSKVGTLSLSRNLYDIQKKIEDRVHKIKTGEMPTLADYDKASQEILSDPINNPLTRITKSDEYLLSSGDKGIKGITAPVQGKISKIIFGNKVGQAISMHAEVELMLNAEDMGLHSFVARGLGYKGTAVIERSLFGAGVTSSAEFLTKGFVGIQKELLLQKIIGNLIELKEHGTVKDKAHATRTIAKLERDLHATFNGNEMIHRSKVKGRFKNIKDPLQLEDAHKFIGNIDMDLDKLNGYMKDAGLIWTEEKANQWYGMFGGNEKSVTKWVQHSVDSLEENLKKNKYLYDQMGDTEFTKHVNLVKSVTKQWLLPSLEKIKKGEAIPMFFEPGKKFADKDAFWEPVFRVKRTGMAVYGLLEGTDTEAKHMRLKANILPFIDNDYSPLTKSSVTMIKNSTRSLLGGRFMAARQANAKFMEKLLGQAEIRGDLSLKDLEKILNPTAGLDLHKLGKIHLDDNTKKKVTETLTNLYSDQGLHEEEVDKAVASVLSELEDDNFAASIKKSKNFLSAESARAWASMAEKKEVFSYSRRPELGGTFSFDLQEMIKLAVGKDEDFVEPMNRTLQFFKQIKNKSDSMVESITDATKKHGPIIKLKRIIMHADTHVQNVANLLNPLNGKENTFGYYSEPNKYVRNTLESAKMIELFHKEGNTEGVELATQTLGVNYLKYILKGYLFDSSSILARATEFAPMSMEGRFRGAEPTLQRFHEIYTSGGWGKVKGFASGLKESDRLTAIKNADAMTERIVKNGNVTDTFVTSNYLRKAKWDIDTDHGKRAISYEKHMRQTLGAETTDNLMFGRQSTKEWENYLYGFLRRPPDMPNGYNAFTDARINIITPEMAEHVAMNDNEMAVHSAYFKLMGGDFDGDRASAVLKGFKNLNTMMEYAQEHSDALTRVLQSHVHSEQKLLTTLGKHLNSIKHFMHCDVTHHGVSLMGYENGQVVFSSVNNESKEAEKAFSENFNFLMDNINNTEMHSHSKVTGTLVKEEVDRVTLPKVSKDNIGLFNNLFYRRTRQLMDIGVLASNNTLSTQFIGNQKSGLWGMNQQFISLGKHDSEIVKLQQACEVLRNPFDEVAAHHDSLKEMMGYFFDLDETNAEKRKMKLQDKYNTLVGGLQQYHKAAPSGSDAYRTLAARANLALGINEIALPEFIQSLQNVNFYDQEPPHYGRYVLEDFGHALAEKLKFSSSKVHFKATGKVGAVVAAIFLAGNFFRPHQLSNSLNPLDGFVDLGTDLNGRHNAISSNLQLDRSLPLDMVNASFSKQAFVKVGQRQNTSKARSNIINSLLQSTVPSNPYLSEWRAPDNLQYSNYTSKIGSFGSYYSNRRYG